MNLQFNKQNTEFLKSNITIKYIVSLYNFENLNINPENVATHTKDHPNMPRKGKTGGPLPNNFLFF